MTAHRLTRLEQVGATKVIGVPGDFTLTLLDAFEGSGVEVSSAHRAQSG